MSPRAAIRLTQQPRRSPAGPLVLAGLCVLALALVWAVAELIPSVQWRDAVLLHDFTLLSRPRVDAAANFLLHLLNPLQFVLWGVALVAVAVARERPRVALAVAAIMSLAPFTAETLKPLLAHPHLSVGGVYIGAASWPSGHSTAALALVYAAVLVTPPRLRPIAATIGALFALAVGCSLLILAWHMPSDVLGGYLVATLWAALAVAAVRASYRRWPPRSRA
jgi:membrane-associated phospholipid phosphatase